MRMFGAGEGEGEGDRDTGRLELLAYSGSGVSLARLWLWEFVSWLGGVTSSLQANWVGGDLRGGSGGGQERMWRGRRGEAWPLGGQLRTGREITGPDPS